MAKLWSGPALPLRRTRQSPRAPGFLGGRHIAGGAAGGLRWICRSCACRRSVGPRLRWSGRAAAGMPADGPLVPRGSGGPPPEPQTNGPSAEMAAAAPPEPREWRTGRRNGRAPRARKTLAPVLAMLEIRSQNHHLAKTLLDLNMEMQRLRNENELSAASESKALNIAISPE
uniref:Uncharacterized protein n=1 Tax=Chelonoidis abingdonii TaxID=106734 RepID=A0A8C0H5Q7_CHEAB